MNTSKSKGCRGGYCFQFPLVLLSGNEMEVLHEGKKPAKEMSKMILLILST